MQLITWFILGYSCLTPAFIRSILFLRVYPWGSLCVLIFSSCQLSFKSHEGVFCTNYSVYKLHKHQDWMCLLLSLLISKNLTIEGGRNLKDSFESPTWINLKKPLITRIMKNGVLEIPLVWFSFISKCTIQDIKIPNKLIESSLSKCRKTNKMP